MRLQKGDAFLLGAVILGLAALLQTIGLVRYLGRLPDDWIGIGLYIAVIAGCATAAAGFYLEWRRQR